MERLVQYLDELEDIVCAVLTIGERIRRALQILFVLTASLLLQVLGVMLALARPSLALAAVALLVAGLLHHAAVAPSGHQLAVS